MSCYINRRTVTAIHFTEVLFGVLKLFSTYDYIEPARENALARRHKMAHKSTKEKRREWLSQYRHRGMQFHPYRVYKEAKRKCLNTQKIAVKNGIEKT